MFYSYRVQNVRLHLQAYFVEVWHCMYHVSCMYLLLRCTFYCVQGSTEAGLVRCRCWRINNVAHHIHHKP